MKTKLAFRAFLAAVAALLLAACGWGEDPQHSAIRYTVTGDAASVTITAVTDSWGTSQDFVVTALPWSASYDNVDLLANPPIYLRVVVAPAVALTSGNADSAVVDHLVDSFASFVAAGVRVGDVARNTGSGDVSVVTAVAPTDLTLTTSDNPFPLGSEPYAIYHIQTLTASAYVDGALLAETSLSSYDTSPLTATVISDNYTAP